jgi:small subunit ribosomal protein S16
MPVVLRLARRGAKKAPFYHVVATDSRNPRDGKFTEEVGTYDPGPTPAKVNLKADRIDHWLKMGAQPSPTVARLIKGTRKQAAPAAQK